MMIAFAKNKDILEITGDSLINALWTLDPAPPNEKQQPPVTKYLFDHNEII